VATGIASPDSGSRPTPQKPGGKSSVGKASHRDQLIDGQLRRTRSRVKAVEVAVGLMTLAVAALAFFLLVVVFDHWVLHGGLSSAERFFLFGMLILGAGYWLATAVLPAVFGRVNPIYAAQTIERSKPSLKNSLINFLLFRKQRNSLHQVVYNALEEQAVTDLSGAHVESAVDRTRLIHLGYVLIGCVIAFAVYFVFSPKDPFTTVQRVVLPWVDVPAPARVSILDIRPGNTTVFRGQPVPVSAEIQGLGGDENVKLLYTTADRQIVDQAIELHVPEGYRHTGVLPESQEGIQQDVDYRIEAGDAVSSIYHVHVVPAPTIVVDRVDYKYPAYTRLDSVTVPHRGDLKALEGTQVTIHGAANQPIKSASIDFNCDGKSDGAMKVDGQDATISFILSLNDARTAPRYDSYQLQIVNMQGLENPEPIKHGIEVVPDLPPEVAFLAPQQDEISVPVDGSVVLEVRAIDPDFALSGVKLLAKTERGALVDQALLPDAPHVGPFNGKYQFSPAKLGLKEGDIVRYVAVADDNKTPQANESTSSERRIRIVAAENANPRQQADPLAQNDAPQDQTKAPSDVRNDGRVQNQGQGNRASKNDDLQPQNPPNEKQPDNGDNQQNNQNNQRQNENDLDHGQQSNHQPQLPNADKNPGDQTAAPLADKPRPPQQPGNKNNPQNEQRPQDNEPRRNTPQNSDAQQPNPEKNDAHQRPNQSNDQSSSNDQQQTSKDNQPGNNDNQQKNKDQQQGNQGGNSRGGQSGKSGSQQSGAGSSSGAQDQSQSEQNGAQSGTQSGKQSSDGSQNNQGRSGDRSSSAGGQEQSSGQPNKSAPVPSDGSDDGKGVERILQRFEKQESQPGANQQGQVNDRKQNGNVDKQQPEKQSSDQPPSNKQTSDKQPTDEQLSEKQSDQAGAKNDQGEQHKNNDKQEQAGAKPSGVNESASGKSDKGESENDGKSNAQQGNTDNQNPNSQTGGDQTSGNSSKPENGQASANNQRTDGGQPTGDGEKSQQGPQTENGQKLDGHKPDSQKNDGGQPRKEKSSDAQGSKSGSPSPANNGGQSEQGQSEKGQGKDGQNKEGQNKDGQSKEDQSKNEQGKDGQSTDGQKSGDKSPSNGENQSTLEKSNSRTEDGQPQGKPSEKSSDDNATRSQQSQPDTSAGSPSKSGDSQSKDQQQSSPTGQQNGQPREKPSGDSNKPNDSSSSDAQSSSNSQRPSNTRGQQDGDRSGNGGQGGGQGANSQGKGSAGQNTPSDQGAGKSEEPGKGESSDKPGGDQKSDRPTAQAGNQKGQGSSSGTPNNGESKSSPESKSNSDSQNKNESSDGSANGGQPSSNSDSSSASNSKSSSHSQAKPTGQRENQSDQKPNEQPKSDDSQPAPSRFTPNAPQREDPAYPHPPSQGAANGMGGLGNGDSGAAADGPQTKPDNANLDYAKKATELALEHLKNAMKNGQEGNELLKNLGWTRAEAEDFIKRQEQRLQDAQRPDPNDPARREAEDALRSLGLRPDRTDRSGNTITSDEQRGLSSGRHTTPPPEYMEQYKAYSQGINSGK